MADLVCFKDILNGMQLQLDHLISSDQKKSQQYYENTLEKLINRLFIVEEEDGADGDDADL